jgi:hypothetical protein
VVKLGLPVVFGVFAFGLLAGGIGGNARFERLDDHRPLCASCHHSTVDLSKLSAEPPHSTDFDAPCHGCHVLPVKEYLQRTFATVGVRPAFVDGVENPTFGGQTCLECHLARGRGALACEQCHAEGSVEVRLDERCEACHADRIPLYPHSKPACRDCHPEVYLDPHGRAEQLMADKLGGDHHWRKR